MPKLTKPVATLYEKADKQLVMRLANSPELSDEWKTNLKKYALKINDGSIAINYFYSKEQKDLEKGRLFAAGPSLQNFPKNIRHTIAKDNYYDIDMENAGPSILLQYCKKNNIKCDLLKSYVKNRDEWFQKIADIHRLSRDECKKLMIKLLYLGNYKVNGDADECNYCMVCGKATFIEPQTFTFDRKQKTYLICGDCMEDAHKISDKNDDYPVCCAMDVHAKKFNLDINGDKLSNKVLWKLCKEKQGIFTDPVIEDLKKFSIELRKNAKEICKIEKDLLDKIKSDNPKASLMSIIITDIENRCLMEMEKFFKEKKYTVGTYCFDGLLVENPRIDGISEIKRIDSELLDKCSKYVYKKTGYYIKLQIKPMEMGIKVPEISEEVEDDVDVRDKILKLENPNYFHYCDGELYIYDERDGLYNTDQTTLNYYLEKNAKYLYKTTYVSDKKTVRVCYGRSATLQHQVYPVFKTGCKDNSFITRTADTSLYKLLFKNGVYDMNTGEFTEGFNHEIVFHEKIEHDFPERNEEYIKYAADMTFNLMLDNPKALITALARALTGDVTKHKGFYFCPGSTNAGKSKFIKAFSTCFGGYIGTFNACALSYKKNNDDDAKSIGWTLLKRFKRILFSSEVNMKTAMDGNLIKKIASGGDEINARLLFKNELGFVPHFIPFCMLNDIPPIEPFDDAVYERTRYVNFSKQFVENPTLEHHIKADADIEKKFKEDKFIAGFTHYILDAFKDFLINGQPEFDAKDKEEWTAEGRQETSAVDLLNQHFELSDNTADFVRVSDMTNFRKKYKKEFATISSKRFNEIIERHFKVKQSKIGRDNIRGWKGIRVRSNFDNVDFEEV